MLGQEGVLLSRNELVGLVRVVVEKGKKIRRRQVTGKKNKERQIW